MSLNTLHKFVIEMPHSTHC